MAKAQNSPKQEEIMRWGCSYIASRSLRKGLEIKHANGQPKISSVIRER